MDELLFLLFSPQQTHCVVSTANTLCRLHSKHTVTSATESAAIMAINMTETEIRALRNSLASDFASLSSLLL